MMASPQLAKAKLHDLIAPAPLLLLYVLAIAGILPQIVEKARLLTVSFHSAPGLAMLSQVATVLFMGLQTVLFIIRRLPESKAPGVMPRLAGLVGSNIPLLFFTLPTVQTILPVTFLSTILTVGGTAASIYVATNLGRSFSILPQARGLVTRGPYRFVRHPLYLAELIAIFGLMFQFAQPWSFLIVLASLAAQFPRMHYEEAILAMTYPSYRAYMSVTPRLVPGFY
jgi:protein-S-isoprenylcysteine O-methyltransferase Ste14